MKKHLVWLILPALLTTSCSPDKMSSPDTAAEAYYEMLIKGGYADFVSGIAYADSMTDDYRSQFAELIQQHAALQQQLHGGYAAVSAASDTVAGDMAEVYLEITFADSSREEIAVPMMRCGKVWKMQ